MFLLGSPLTLLALLTLLCPAFILIAAEEVSSSYRSTGSLEGDPGEWFVGVSKPACAVRCTSFDTCLGFLYNTQHSCHLVHETSGSPQPWSSSDAEKLFEKTGTLAPSGGGPCPPAFTRIPEGCFLASTSRKAWFGSEAECQTYGSHVHLATIDTQEKMTAVINMAPGNYWIGAYDPSGNNNVLFIATGQELPPGDALWAANQPVLVVNYDCVVLLSSTGLECSKCSNTKTFICEATLN